MRSLLALLTLTLCAYASNPAPIAVGNCQPEGAGSSYPTITQAIEHAESGATILVCPGAYPEEITITKSLELRGTETIASGMAPVITMPPGGILLSGNQITVAGYIPGAADGYNPPAPVVRLTNLIVDGTGNTYYGGSYGIYYETASGTLINLELRNMSIGIVQGSIDNTVSVRIQNSYIHDTVFGIASAVGGSLNINKNIIEATYEGINTYSGTEVIVTQNDVLVTNENGPGIGMDLSNCFECDNSETITVVGNKIKGAEVGLFIGPTDYPQKVVITNNTLVNTSTGIEFAEGEERGAFVDSGASVLYNHIIRSKVAVSLNCYSTFSAVQYNLIDVAVVGIADILPSETTEPNKFAKVGTDTTQCPSGNLAMLP